MIKDQGQHSSELFRGASESRVAKLLYAESANLFVREIKKFLKPNSYTLADIGGHKGEFLGEILKKLPEYNFDSIVVDVNKDLDPNVKALKIESDVCKLPLEDKRFDLVIVRYVLSWNKLEKQRDILREIFRITKGMVILQHQGASVDNPSGLQQSLGELFSGNITKLKREECFFTDSGVIESWLKDFGILYEKVQDRRIENVSELFIEKYDLSTDEAEKVRLILKGNDYVMQTTWVIKFSRD